MKKLILFSSVLLSLNANAAGTFDLDGKVRSFSPSTVDVYDGHYIYSVEKNKITPAERERLKNIKIGEAITLHIPFNAVSDARTLASTKDH